MSARAGIYLDANAGAPLQPRVVEELLRQLQEGSPVLANPSSIHAHGRKAKRLLAESRERVAKSLGRFTDPEQLIFTSSGSESNQLAIRSVLEPLLQNGKTPHWITTPVEHDSTLKMVDWFKGRGGQVDFLPVDEVGQPQFAELERLWKSETSLVTVVWVNNETGVISEIQGLGEKVKSLGAVLHLDGAQAWGKIPIDLKEIHADYVSFSGHKIGALSGVGVLYLNRGMSISPMILGKQEKGRRGGTENLLPIVSVGAAASQLNPMIWAEKVQPLRDRLEAWICAQIPGVHVNGAGGVNRASARRIANTLNLSFDGVEGEGLVMALDLAGYSVSAGSACSSGVLEPSHVLMALGRTREQAKASIRVSLSESTHWNELQDFGLALQSVVKRFREFGAQSLAERSEREVASL